MGTARYGVAGQGTSTAALGSGGYTVGSYKNNTEEFSATVTLKTVTDS